MRHQLTLIAFVLSLLSCKKENIDLPGKLLTDAASASNKNSKKVLPKRIWHAYLHYVDTWDFFYNKRGEVDSIDLLIESSYYGQLKMGYKVYYSGSRIDSVTRTYWGDPWDILRNIKYENGLIVEADLYPARIFNNPPVKWKLEYDNKKRPLNSPIGERFYYDDKGNLISYTHPVVLYYNASYESDNKENPMHRIPNLNIIMLNETQTAAKWYNPHNVTTITFDDGQKVNLENTYDYMGNLITQLNPRGFYSSPDYWVFVY
ncbi:MAG TPA: hypothetical protein VFX73_00830 [Chitinophagaceae bacterium]|nr:hypothetical protein [Chitinophagaceae bacterium]